jgi:oxygen-independent coproporphyrinogen-3 oxidase
MVLAAASAVPPSLQFDTELIRRLDRPGPRYASYPTADRFSDSFGYGDYLQAVSSVRARGGCRALSLYLHIPFCESGCHYCARNKIVTRNRDQLATYLDYLGQESRCRESCSPA